MNPPRATYRLQFRNGMTFERAADLAPYLADLGVSHLYASPIFAAAPGSAHGYDVADHRLLDPELGGEEGLARLSDALKAHGLGLILDIVPNHMAVSSANPWWRHVLKWGSQSTYARHFDIDWSAPKLLLPVLGEPYGEALTEEKLELHLDAEAGTLEFGYFELRVPLALKTYSIVLDTVDELGDLLDRAAIACPSEEAYFARTFAAALSEPTVFEAVEAAVADVNRNRERLHAVHEAQVWRLAYWRLAREALTYRRFFEIADLVGVRVENAAVFSDVHTTALRLVREGAVDGLRIDHIDGLSDPKGYLARLRSSSNLDCIYVEKILGPGEELRGDWECAGTTGYEVARWITALQVDQRNESAMTAAWTGFCGDDPSFQRQVLNAKRSLLTGNLAGELAQLVNLAHRVAQADIKTRDFGRDALVLAITEIIAALPVYRTYIDHRGVDPEDREIVSNAVEAALQSRQVEDDRVVRFVGALLLQEGDISADRAAFIRRFQQTSGPLTAKSVEDTVFYRYNRLISLNEVGAEPADFGTEPETFHDVMTARSRKWPLALSSTGTHDTKRGEDARARLAVLSEMPESWAQAVEDWHLALRHLRTDSPQGSAPGREAEWLFFQALMGAWPLQLSPDDEEGLADLSTRLEAFMLKALREAKQRTSWTDPDEAYENAVTHYVTQVFAPANRKVLRGMAARIQETEAAGFVNSLAQLTLKLTLPGVPDIYQGCEFPEFSLVDPDNRRPVDFAHRQRRLNDVRQLFAAEVMKGWREGLPKLWLLERLLDLRRRRSALFAQGSYRAIEVEGDGAEHVIAFQRRLGDETVVVAVPRLVLRALSGEGLPALDPSAFKRARLTLPQRPEQFRTLTGVELSGEDRCLAASALFPDFPVCVLEPR